MSSVDKRSVWTPDGPRVRTFDCLNCKNNATASRHLTLLDWQTQFIPRPQCFGSERVYVFIHSSNGVVITACCDREPCRINSALGHFPKCIVPVASCWPAIFPAFDQTIPLVIVKFDATAFPFSDASGPRPSYVWTIVCCWIDPPHYPIQSLDRDSQRRRNLVGECCHTGLQL